MPEHTPTTDAYADAEGMLHDAAEALAQRPGVDVEAMIAKGVEILNRVERVRGPSDWLASLRDVFAALAAARPSVDLSGVQRYVFDDEDVDPGDEFVRVADLIAATRPSVSAEVEWGVRWPEAIGGEVEPCGAPGTDEDASDEYVAEYGGVRVRRTVTPWEDAAGE